MKNNKNIFNPADPAQNAAAERRAIASSCCGFTGEAVLTDSAVVMLFAGMIGAGEALKLLTTAVFPFLSGLLMLPMAYIAMRSTCRRLTVGATILAAAAYFACAFTPFFGAYKVQALLIVLILFAVSLSGFVAGWFPLLDTFLLPERRTYFIGKMRFMHQLSAVIFLLITGWVLGKNPSLGSLQVIILIAGIIFVGRAIFIWLLPPYKEEKTISISWKDGINTAWHNKPLRNGAFYLGALNLSAYGITPLWIIYLQQNGQSGNSLVYISAAALSGMMLGYLSVGKLKIQNHYHVLGMLHKAILVLLIILLFLPAKGISAAISTGAVLLCLNYCIALISVCATALMLKVATPGNKTMAMALFGAIGNTGMGASRVLGAMLINPLLIQKCEKYCYFSIFQSTLLVLIVFLAILMFFRRKKAWA